MNRLDVLIESYDERSACFADACIFAAPTCDLVNTVCFETVLQFIRRMRFYIRLKYSYT